MIYSQQSLSWFDFLLKPELLETHLSQPNPDPSVFDLIIQFLTNSENVSSSQITVQNEEPESISQEPASKISRKSVALKFLALKTMSFIKWKFGPLGKNIPLPLQYSLMNYLLQLTCQVDSVTSDLDIEKLLPYQIFGLGLYICWSVKALTNSLLPKKPNKTALILPNNSAVTATQASLTEVEILLKKLEADFPVTKVIFKKLIDSECCQLCLPNTHCFGTLSENQPVIRLFWDKAELIDTKELQCKCAFDLGCYLMILEKYDEAALLFQKSRSLLPMISNRRFCDVSEKELIGYCLATGVIKQETNLLNRYQQALSSEYKNLISILREDNKVRELPMSWRNNLEYTLLSSNSSHLSDLYFEVVTCNVIRRVLEGNLALIDYLLVFSEKLGPSEMLFLKTITEEVKKEFPINDWLMLKEYLFSLAVQADPNMSGLNPEVQKCLFEICDVQFLHNQVVNEIPSVLLTKEINQHCSSDKRLELGYLEKELIETYDSSRLKELIHQLLKADPHLPLRSLYAKNFSGAIHLLDLVIKEVESSHSYKSTSWAYKLIHLTHWELLLVQISEFLETWPKQESVRELKVSAIKCLHTLNSGELLIPRSELVENCVAFLLNIGEWQPLAEADSGWTLVQLAALLAQVCHMIMSGRILGPNPTSDRLWNAILNLLHSGSGSVSKRSSSVSTRESPQSSLSRQTFRHFLGKIRERLVFSVIISCLCHLHNQIRDESTQELQIEYSSLWPTSVRHGLTGYNLEVLEDYLDMLLEQGLTFHPDHVPWLQIRAEFCYANKQWSSVLHNYLEILSLTTNFYAHCPSQDILTDSIIHRLIHCCCQLRNYTQAAIFCQFCNSVDYSTAFKWLGERNCTDANDAYYGFIWDVTILEFLVQLHHRRGELEKKNIALKMLGILELNANNNEEVLKEAITKRKLSFLQALTIQYLALSPTS